MMDKPRLFDSLDGLFAYDMGAVDSGIKDERLRHEVKQELERQAALPENEHRTFPKIIDEFAYEHYFSPKAREQGYGSEDFINFVKWLEELMGWDLI